MIFSNSTWIYLIVLAIPLYISYIFLMSSLKDVRTKKRFRFKSYYVRNKIEANNGYLKSKKYDELFRSMSLPTWINSVHYNLVRLIFGIVALAIFLMNNIFSISIVPSIWFYVIASIPIIMEPTKNMPSYHLLLLFKKIIDNKKNSENYQLYHEIMNEFHTKGKNLDNLYHLIYSLRPYFKQIRPTLENMLPLLRDYKYEEAWALFSNEIGTKEAKNLALLMQEVENTSVENAIKKLELRKSEFANSLYESLKDYLAIKHAVIYAIVLVGGFFVVINPFVAFWLWHRLTMNEINNFQILIGG